MRKTLSINTQLLLTSLLMIVTAFSLSLIVHKDASALSGGDFRAGEIIDDYIFTNKSSMSVGQIQQFLNAKMPTCDTWGNGTYNGVNRATYARSRGVPVPFTCLKDYYENPTTHANNLTKVDGQLAAIPTGGLSAAQLIYNVSQQFNLNPQVLVVMLEKEEGLIQDDWPWPYEYQSAVGYGCPDHADCDSQYYGFYNQIYNAARQFTLYAQHPYQYNYVANANNFIQWSPNSSCGGSTVFIVNQATADLYNYTPYQPNQAALNNLYGSGDSCSAYGNRNFWRLFNDWFGRSIGNLVTSSAGGGGVYLLENNTKRAFPSEINFFSYGYAWQNVITIGADTLAAIPDGTPVPYNVHFRDQRLVGTSSGGVYAIENGQKRAFPGATEFLSWGYKWTDVISLTSAEIALIPDGTPVEYNVHFRDQRLVGTSSGGVYAIENGQKRAFPGATEFLSWGYKWTDVISLTSAEIALIPDGTPVEYNVHFRDGRLITSGGGIYLVQNGLKRPFPDQATFLSYGYSWSNAWWLSPYEMNLIPDGAPMPPKQ